MALGSTISQITKSGLKPGLEFPSLVVAGVLTATTLKGDGSGLTGVASTDNINTSTPATFGTIDATGISTFRKGLKVGPLTSIGATHYTDGSIRSVGIITASSFVGNLTGNVTGNLTGNVTGNLTGTATELATNATGANLTLSGNLGVGGTLTYEDVTRVDAVGLSTFREGLQVGPLAGIAATVYKDGSIRSTGVITATSYYGSGANLTGIDATAIQTGNTVVQTNASRIDAKVSNVGILTVSSAGINLTGIVTAITGSFSGTVTATSFSGSGASLTGIVAPLSNRNVLDNGCFAVRQKGNVTWNTVSSNTKQIPDRWQGWTNVSGFNIAVTAGTPPIDKGFATCIKLDNNAAVTPGTNDLCQWQTTLEGQDCQRFKFGSSDAEDLTLSFWCKASATAAGQYGIQLMYTDVGNSGHQCNQKFTAATSWTKHTITFPGTGSASTTGEGIKNGGSAGFYVYICLAAGSGKLSGSGTNTWASGGNHVWPTGQHNFLGNTSNELEFTGFQLETGSTATEYEHKNYTEELSRCKRYYQRYGYPKAFAIDNGTFVDATCWAMMLPYDGDDNSGSFAFATEMRATPSLTGTDSQGGGDYIRIHSPANDFNGGNYFQVNNSCTTHAAFHIDTPGGLSTTQQAGFFFNNANGWFALDAEL